MGWKIWQALFDALPDVSGVLLAAVGVAIVIAPEPIQNLEKRKYVRWILAAALVAMGVAGLWSSFLQRGRDGIEKSELHGDVRDLKIELAKFGPKLDWIISHPQSKSQQSQAIDLKREIAAAIGRPRVELSEPRLTYFKDGRVTFMFPETNTGSTIARGKLNTTDMLVGSNEKTSEDRLFDKLHSEEDITTTDTPRSDMGRGYEYRSESACTKTFSADDWNDLVSNKKLLYAGFLVTYFDDAGTKYHTEMCWKWSPKYQSLGTCIGHNKID